MALAWGRSSGCSLPFLLMKRLLLFCAFCGLSPGFVRAQSTMDIIGVTALTALDPTLTGSGVVATQVEAAPAVGQYEVDPGSPGQPVSLFTYWSAPGTSGAFPNTVGSESGHADQVAEAFYGENTGVSPGLQHVGNYEMTFFYSRVIQTLDPLTAIVFNQSFEFGSHNTIQDQAYDDYIAQWHTVVASGVGNGGAVLTPADCYNGVGVGAYGGTSSVGPTADGRCKPDITAPAGVTSFSTPLVSGAAALLIQGGRRMGVDATAAIDSRTVKALLLNGAVKPSGWTHSSTAPLDPNFGAGILNVFNSYVELGEGRVGPVAMTFSGPTGHPALARGPVIATVKGWDFHSIRSGTGTQGVNHYRIATSGTGALIATLVWNKGYQKTGINRLALYAYDGSRHLLASSASRVDNVQHIYVTGLGAGTYELEVVKVAESPGVAGFVSRREDYALAWDFER